ncbi:MAG: toxin-antitoxin system HicB family antitoxin [Desulfobacterales bacterium]|nr:toxin-antitoxin system HicB family antitoxin [Desulfobacterales bacterium]
MSQIEISLPETLLYQLETEAGREGISLEQYILFALTRQTMLTPVIRNVSEKDAEHQHKDYAERIKRLGKASSEELDEILRERETVVPGPDLKPETVPRLKNRIAEAKAAS